MHQDSPPPVIEDCVLKTRYGDFRLFCFSWSQHEEDNVLVLVKEPHTQNCLVRVQSACYTGEIFGSTDCDCHEQLETSLQMIAKSGGIFVYMLRDGRGAGLLTKLRGLRLYAEQGIDTADAYDSLGVARDPRAYDQACYVLRHFGLNKIRLLTNNPRKIAGIESENIDVARVPLEIPATSDSESYLRTKAVKMGHYLAQFERD